MKPWRKCESCWNAKGASRTARLKRQFNLDDDYLEELKDELIEAERVAVDEDGKVLVWIGAAPVPSSKLQVSSSKSQLPVPPRPLTPNPQAAYTPPHLAERIRAEQAALEARGATDGERKTITPCLPISKARRR